MPSPKLAPCTAACRPASASSVCWGHCAQDLYRPALISLVLLVGGLALARLYSTLTSDLPVGSYTYGAMVYEFTTAILAGLALRKS